MHSCILCLCVFLRMGDMCVLVWVQDLYFFGVCFSGLGLCSLFVCVCVLVDHPEGLCIFNGLGTRSS